VRWEGHRHALIPDLQRDFSRRRSLEVIRSNCKVRSSSPERTQPSSDHGEPGARLPSNAAWQLGRRQGGTAPRTLPASHTPAGVDRTLAPAPAAAHATAARGGDSCAGKWQPAPSRQPFLPRAPASPLPTATHTPGKEPTPSLCAGHLVIIQQIFLLVFQTPGTSVSPPSSAPSSSQYHSAGAEPTPGCASTQRPPGHLC